MWSVAFGNKIARTERNENWSEESLQFLWLLGAVSASDADGKEDRLPLKYGHLSADL